MSSPDYLRSTESLADEMLGLRLHETEPYLTEERKQQLRRRMAVISFELQCRAEESADARTSDG